jgi:hypothetical protein
MGTVAAVSYRSFRDEPVSDPDDDLLQRAGYAAELAALIAGTHTWKASTVFGLTGPWGSGKTTLLGQITQELENLDKGYTVVWFTPWAAHDANGVLADFYAALFSALPKKMVKKARKSFATLLRVAAPAGGLVPVGGSVATSAIAATAEALDRAKPWSEAFKEVEAQIVSGNHKILVVVDDIDRLQGSELLTVLKVIRLLGRFKGMQYLIAYDHESLIQILISVGAAPTPAEAGRYIEKMVQYPLPMPALVDGQIVQILTSGLHDVLQRRRPDPAMTGATTSDLLPSMLRILTTPRALGRYLAQLDYELSLHHPDEVNDEDIMALVLLRTATPSLYARLPRYEDQLVGRDTSEAGGQRRGTSDQSTIKKVTEGMEPAEREVVIEILHLLFPNLRGSGYAMERRRGVSDAAYFRRYFVMGILAGHDIPDARIVTAIRSAMSGEGENLTSLLRTDGAPGLLAFAKLQDNFRSEFEQVPNDERDDAALTLLAVLIPTIDDFAIPRPAGYFVLSEQICFWLGAYVLPQLSDGISLARLTAAFDQTSARVRAMLLHTARGRLDGRRVSWWTPIHEATLPAAQAEFLAHLRQRDNAPDERNDLIEFIIDAAAAGVDLEPAREAIAAAIADGEFTIEDLAARFVLHEPNSGSGFQARQVQFELLAPDTDDPWYDRPGELPDGDRWQWRDRRAAATAIIKRPSSSPDV